MVDSAHNKYNVHFHYTNVTQDGDPAAICKIGQITTGSLWGLIERRGSAANRSKVPKVAEVAGKFLHAQNKRHCEIGQETGFIETSAPWGSCGHTKSAVTVQ